MNDQMNESRREQIAELSRSLALSKPYVVGLLVYLWWDAHDRKRLDEQGVLGPQTLSHIVEVTNWPGPGAAREFADTLVKCGFMRRVTDDSFVIHDYYRWVPWFVQDDL